MALPWTATRATSTTLIKPMNAQTPIRPPSRLLLDPGHLLSLGFGTGLSPVAPGTFGTLAALPFILAWWLTGAHWVTQAASIIVMTAIGIWCSGRTTRTLGCDDHPGIVVDEIAGMMITMFLVPPGLLNALLGFGLFRLFDILKPWPIRWLDRNIHGGLGIMADDVLAGVVACAILHVTLASGVLP
jgi:phosphatidylglycerophosphatase A